jgi:hypothetical protein
VKAKKSKPMNLSLQVSQNTRCCQKTLLGGGKNSNLPIKSAVIADAMMIEIENMEMTKTT